MKTKNDDYDALKEIRRIRKKHYEETKNMSMKERMEYYHRKSEALREEMAKMNYKNGKIDFPFLFLE
ncbi:MAG: hypothetical protein LBC02_10110 [Planctomycetaceae bacterium]|jgi:hypothetical protein|nr:hypothetical protein [Planctomycetaceae bacterium]